MEDLSNGGVVVGACTIAMGSDKARDGTASEEVGATIPNDPFIIDEHSKNSGDIIPSSSPFSPGVDGFFLLNTDNDGSTSDGDNFNLVFKVEIIAPGATGASATLFSQATGNQGPTVSAIAFLNIPIRRGSKVSVSYYGSGVNNLAKPIRVRMWFHGISSSTD